MWTKLVFMLLDVFFCVLNAYNIYKKNTVLLTSHTDMLMLLNKINDKEYREKQ